MAEKETKRKLAVLEEVKTPPGLPASHQAKTPWGLTDLPFKNSQTAPYDDMKMPHGLEPENEDDALAYPSPIPIPQRKAKR